jgi:hypothetical protein
LSSRISARPRLPSGTAIRRSSNSSTSWPPGWGTGPQPRSGGRAIRPLQPPGGARDAPDQEALQGALGRQLVRERRLERRELDGVIVRQHDILLRAQAVFERVLRRACLAFGGPRPADFAPFLRLAAARALPTETAARGAAPALDMAGFLGWLAKCGQAASLRTVSPGTGQSMRL